MRSTNRPASTTLVLLLATILLAGCRQQAPEPVKPRVFDDQRRALHLASFDHVWKTIRDNHWDPNLNGVDWDAARDELRPKVESADSDAQARAAMEELIGRLNQSHFGIIPADVYERVAEIPSRDRPETESQKPARRGQSPATAPDTNNAKRSPGESGIHVRVVGDRAIVTRVDPDSAGAVAGVQPGWELLGVGRFKVQRMLDALRRAHADSSMLPAYQSVGATGLLSGDEGRVLVAQFRDGRGRTVERKITLLRPAGNPSRFGNLPDMYVHTDVREITPRVGYVWFSAFLDTANVMGAFRGAIERFRDADGLIIDLRGNPGGIGFMANGMAGYIVDQPNLKLGEMMMRGPTGPTTIRFVVNPQPTLFNGPVAVLVDECSMSTSEIMAGGLQDIGRARVFGTPTPGAALPSVIEKLPNGDGFQYAFANYVSAKGDVLEGRGVTPDERIPPDPEALLQGRDPVIEAAVTWIRSQRAPQ